MNIFKRFWCRTYQVAMRIILPLLPYREPKILKDYQTLAKVLKEENKKNVLIVTDASLRSLGLTKNLEQELLSSGFSLTIFDKTVANPTTENVEESLQLYNQNHCDSIVAFGGGSPIDCAKATGARSAQPNKTLGKMKGVLKVRKKIPLLVAIPTTAGTGSETTLSAVITDSKTRHKYAINDFALIPQYALLDAKLTQNLPPFITATTGMDALTHAVEAFIGRSTTKKTRKNSLEAIKLIFENIEECYSNGKNLVARENMLKASYLAGLAFSKSYVGYVHAIAHSLGGKYNIAHGLANAIILPVVLKKYGAKINKKLWKMGVFANLFEKNVSKQEGATLFIQKIEYLNSQMGIKTKIPEIDVNDIPELAKTAEKEANPLYPVPVLFTKTQLEDIYRELI